MDTGMDIGLDCGLLRMCGMVDCHVFCAELCEFFLSGVALTIVSKYYYGQ